MSPRDVSREVGIFEPESLDTHDRSLACAVDDLAVNDLAGSDHASDDLASNDLAGANDDRTTGDDRVDHRCGNHPVDDSTAPPTTQPAANDCDPNYSGCVPIASDVDCAGGSGNGPAYVQGPVQVTGADIYDLDRDGNGIGCENG